ncbi:MAG: class I SAM-dependent methyltransferase, partial [Alphaproteobacteria bacterium]|nr:class I SAM-dependent methyltransferase [Alphaproteobacteria bacterium]
MTAAAKPLAFDDIHTQKKQQQLTQMMHSIAAKVRGMPNANSTRSACPVCAHAPVDFFVNAFGFEMSQCGDCGLIFCNPYPSLAQLDVYYNSEMKSFENEFFRESFDKRINIFLPRIELIQRYGGKG